MIHCEVTKNSKKVTLNFIQATLSSETSKYSTIRQQEKLAKDLPSVVYKGKEIEYINLKTDYLASFVGRFKSFGYNYGGYQVGFDYSLNDAQSREFLSGLLGQTELFKKKTLSAVII